MGGLGSLPVGSGDSAEGGVKNTVLSWKVAGRIVAELLEWCLL